MCEFSQHIYCISEKGCKIVGAGHLILAGQWPGKDLGLQKMTEDVAKDRFEIYFMYEVSKTNGLDTGDLKKKKRNQDNTKFLVSKLGRWRLQRWLHVENISCSYK